MNFPDPHNVGALITELAHEIIIPRFGKLQARDVHYKQENSPVTTADRLMEERMSVVLPDFCPGSIVVGEEAVAEDVNILLKARDHDCIWLLDPVDGTSNFVKGSHDFCAMLALIYQGRTVMSWIYFPMHDIMAIAANGDGAQVNERPLLLSPPPKTAMDWHGVINFNIFAREDRAAQRNLAKARFGTIQSLHCAGADFLKLSQGIRHFSLYRKIWPWDHAPGVLLLEEAGGTTRLLDAGVQYHPLDRVSGLLSCGSKNICDDIANFAMMG
ncbi:MAG: inositol monophosphatase, partial [Pseudomonadota bacterium]